jgi:hypothetical protein
VVCFALLLKLLTLSALSRPVDCVEPGLNHAHDLQATIHSIQDQIAGNPLAFDHITEKSDSYTFNNYGLGFSYFIASENSRFEKLDGYDDVYIWVNHYDPKAHSLNRLFLGSNAILKIDRSKNPAKIIYLSREKHVQSKSAAEIMDLKNVNESLCALNRACSEKLRQFNATARTAQFDSKVVSEYKTTLSKLISDHFILDTYAETPVVTGRISKLLDQMKLSSFKNTSEMNDFLLQGLKMIQDEKLNGMTRDQYVQKFKGEENKAALEHITYNSISDNALFLIGKFSHRAKKDAILDFCSKSGSSECVSIRSLKTDLDSFQMRRRPLPAGEELPRI